MLSGAAGAAVVASRLAAAANRIPKVYAPEESARYTFEMASDPEALYCEFQPDLEYEEEMCGGAHKG